MRRRAKESIVPSTIGRSTSIGLLALALAACSPGAGPAPPAPGTGTGTPVSVTSRPGQPVGSIDACTLLTDGEIEAATGEGVSERRQSTLTQVFPSVCDIVLDGGGSLTVGILAPGGRSMYERSFEPFIGGGSMPALDEAVSGLGDKAARSGQTELMVLHDDVLFDLQFFGARPDKLPAIRYLAERILARLTCIATGCPPMTVPPAPTIGPATPEPAPPTVDPATLPSTGARARFVNLYSENGQRVELDVFAWTYAESGMGEIAALVATVPYGQASDWFNPGLVKSPFDDQPYTKVTIERRGDGPRPFGALAGTSEFLGPGTVTTISVWQEVLFDAPAALLQAIYAEHPVNPVPRAPDGQGLIVSRNSGLLAEEDPPILYASVGDGCLVHPLSDPSFPSAQPVANDLVVPPGEHTLTLHEEPEGGIPDCTTPAVGAGVPITVAAGDRLLLFAYRLPGAAEVSQLVLPFDE
jgi:hypothetical protein